MSSYKTDQRYVVHRGRKFHFVSYEGHQANPAKAVAAVPPTWYLMSAGKRWAVMPQSPDEAADAVDSRLIGWLDANVFAAGPERPLPLPSPSRHRGPSETEAVVARTLGGSRRNFR